MVASTMRQILTWVAFVVLLVNPIVECRPHNRKTKNKKTAPSSPYDPETPQSPVVPSEPYPSSSTVFDVTSFGAVGDGSSDDTAAFQAAWQSACSVDSGVVLAPDGYNFVITSSIFSGPCKSGLVFQVDGNLVAPDGPDSWPESDSKKQWLVFYRLGDMVLTGKGTIEGNGNQWWDLPCKPHRSDDGSSSSSDPCYSPTMIRFFMSSNIAVTNLRVQNGPQFHLKFEGCQQILIRNLSISSPKLSPNTDGIHLQDTNMVGIYDTDISNGDDCISIGPGTTNVEINGVTCGPSHGISIGSLGRFNSQACVSNITVRNSVIRESDNGVRIKTWQGGSGSVSDIVFENIQMENVRNCMNIDQYYCMSKACRNVSSAVYVSGVSFRNIKGTYDVRSPPIHFACSDTVACTNITMSEVELLPEEGELVDDPYCWNAYGYQQTPTIPPINCLQEGEPQRFFEASSYGGC